MARDTTFYLYKNVNLSPSTGDTFYFANRTAQTTFFATKLYRTFTACSYQRKNRNYIKVNVGIASCYDIDYLCFLNPSYENKRFYAFVEEVNYVSDNCTEIGYTVDVVQTWLLDCTVEPCMIERAHTPTDTAGDNLLEDGLECGDYIVDWFNSDRGGVNSDMLVIFQCSFDAYRWATDTPAFTHKGVTATVCRSGVYDALSLVAFYCEIGNDQNTFSLSALGAFLEAVFTGQGGVTMEDIVNVYIYPKRAVDLSTGATIGTGTGYDEKFNKIYEVADVAHDANNVKGEQVALPSRPLTLNGYTPKNNKLFTFPYCLLHMMNNNGSAVDLKFERFADPTQPTARFFGTTTAEAKVRIVPENYMGGSTHVNADLEFGLDSAPFPTVSQISEAYTVWLTQNRNTIENNYHASYRKYQFGIGTTAVNSAGSILGSAFGTSENGQAKGAWGALMGGVSTLGNFANSTHDLYRNIKSMRAEQEDRKVAPATASGLVSQGLAFQNGRQNFSFLIKTIDAYHAQMIDDFWTMYGYPIKKIQTPNFHARTKWTYVKTAGAVLHGAAPESDKSQIASLLNAGIRFWSDQANIGNYSLTNGLLS